jgi:predicted alpha/beta superfamily hydrolase
VSASSSSGTGGTGGAGGAPAEGLDAILAELRADTQKALIKHAASTGWPAPVTGGWLFVCTDPSLPLVAGDHDGWKGTALMPDQGFSWVVINVAQGDHYKFTDGSQWVADPFSRSYDYDNNGEISLVQPAPPHLDRFFAVGDATLGPRTVRVWIPPGPITRVLYVHDGQNLFDPSGPWGGWHLQDTAPDGMLVVGIDNTPARMDEYTHVQDDIDGTGALVGGKADAYADLLQNTVRPLVKGHYGEPGPVGVMGSSLGGLISFEIAYRYPGEYAFAASLSGTMGWGSIGAEVHNQTMIQRYQAKGHQMPILYLDSGGYGTTCADSDGDGTNDDDQNSADNYCENTQMKGVLLGIGYTDQKDLFYWHEPNAQHNEAAWAARVFRPLGVFAGL